MEEQKSIELVIMLNVWIIEGYFILALVLSFLQVVFQYKRLKELSMVEQFVLFTMLPILTYRELKRTK